LPKSRQKPARPKPEPDPNQSLINARVSIERNGERLWLAGICENSANLNAAGTTFKGDECVLLCAYSPEILPILLTSEASDGGPWADLMLCGHTHGGQIRLFGRSVLNLTRQEQKYLSGWTTDNGMPILTTTGVGCEGLNLRLGSEPEVWLITLSKSKSGNVSRETIG
jgi:predicted MPP superfamily phosphohydrolase